MRRIAFMITIVIASGILAGCDFGLFSSPKREAVGSLVLDLSAIHRPAGEGQQFPVCFSAIQSVQLSITGGRPPVRRLPVEQDQTVIEFPNVRVRPGTVVFTANILSSNDDVLFSGERTAEIEEDGFQVNVATAIRNPVLVVCHLLEWQYPRGDFCDAGQFGLVGRFDVSFFDTGTVTWAMTSPVQAQGTLTEPRRPFEIGIRECLQGDPEVPLRVTSNFGDIEATLRPP